MAGQSRRMAPAAAPLSAADQKRFAAGQEIYKNLCEGCHGADGREQPGATPNIAGAPSVIGAPGVPIRVLLHGKEGPIGLMPAHGDTLNDAEIAAVLTYIRRAWGQTAAPIDAAAVQQVRTATAGRTARWTPEELARSSETCTKQKDAATIAEQPKAARHRSRGWGPTTN